MLYTVTSACLSGIEALSVRIEVDISLGLPGFTIVGLPDAAIRESKERVRAAVKNCGYLLPPTRTVVNLAPADRKKEGSSFDLPIAAGLLAQLSLFPAERLDDYLFTGELALDGSLKSIRGVLSSSVLAKQRGFKGIVVPKDNEKEAALVKGIDVYGLRHISEMVSLLSGTETISPTVFSPDEWTVTEKPAGDFFEIRGQNHVKRSLEVAAAGGHNVLMIGPPGAGKTMMARRLPSILPPLEFEEIIEVTRIYSVAGMLKDKKIFNRRPFRAPHHTITDAGLIGGGNIPRPGEVTLAHNGVLFLDELPEFRRKVLEDLRQPVEDGCVTISRASQTVTLPSSFMLVAAMNPFESVMLGGESSPGNYSECLKKRYYAKISGPLVDRIDIQVEVPKLEFKDLSAPERGECSETIRQRVTAARKRQRRRFAGRGKTCNDQMGAEEIQTFCRPDREGKTLLRMAVDRLGFSARAYSRALKVARTIADLEGEENILPIHISESIQYRIIDKFFRKI